MGRPAAGLRAEARGAGAAPESVPVPPAAVRASAAGAPPGRARGGGVGGRGAGEEGERRRGRFGARVSRTARKGPRSARAPSGGPARARAGGAAGDVTHLALRHHDLPADMLEHVGPGWEWYLDRLVGAVTGMGVPGMDVWDAQYMSRAPEYAALGR